ncbi:MAG: hypothetical protein ACXVPD_13240 [Bacteroidia bacterium]
MRPLVFISVLLLSGNLFSQDAKEEPGAKKDNFKVQEVVVVDSTPSSELLKRAVNWVKVESPRFAKTNGVTTGTKAECVAVFKVKPKELNPGADYTGTITIHVSIECKENRYRYVISKAKHTSTSGQVSGGDMNNVVPDCGSMIMPDNVWKKLKGEAMKGLSMIVSELKEGMSQASSTGGGKDEW